VLHIALRPQEYELSLSTVNPVHLGPGEGGEGGNKGMQRREASETAQQGGKRAMRKRRKLHDALVEEQENLGQHDELDAGLDSERDADPSDWDPEMDLEPGMGLEQALRVYVGRQRVRQDGAEATASSVPGGNAAPRRGRGVASGPRRALLASTKAGADIDEHGNDGDDEVEQGATSESTSSDPGSAWTGADRVKPKAVKGLDSAKSVPLEDLWADTRGLGNCRRSNVLFTFVDGDFNDMPYPQQLKTIFRTGVLVGVHGAGLTHGFFMPPGQSTVLQLLGESFAKVGRRVRLEERVSEKV
jgi:hypothetical protein